MNSPELKPLVLDSTQKEIKSCVMCIIGDGNGNYLFVQHKKCKDKLSLPAGTVEPNIDRTTKNTAIREMEEELGIIIDPLDLHEYETHHAYYDRIDGHKIYKETIFLVSDYHGEVVNKEPLKHPRLVWMPSTEVFNNPELFTYSTWKVMTELAGKDL